MSRKWNTIPRRDAACILHVRIWMDWILLLLPVTRIAFPAINAHCTTVAISRVHMVMGMRGRMWACVGIRRHASTMAQCIRTQSRHDTRHRAIALESSAHATRLLTCHTSSSEQSTHICRYAGKRPEVAGSQEYDRTAELRTTVCTAPPSATWPRMCKQRDTWSRDTWSSPALINGGRSPSLDCERRSLAEHAQQAVSSEQ